MKFAPCLTVLLIAGLIFLSSPSSFSEGNLLARARRYMLIHNERAYQRAEKIFSLLENREIHYKTAYLRIKNILNWSEYYGRSKSLLMKRLISFADSLIQAAIERYPENKDDFLLLSALSVGLKGKRHHAREILLKLKAKFGTESYYKYLNWKFAGYRPDPLDDALDDIIKQNPLFFKARFDRARWYFNLGILHLATDEAGVLLAMKPRSPWVITFFGVCMLEHNDPGNAQGYFKKALSIENYSPAIFEMGRSLYLYGKLNESLQYFTKTLILDPAHVGANYYIGKAYMILGNNLKASYHLKRYIALNPNSIDKEDVEKWINRLTGNRRT